MMFPVPGKYFLPLFSWLILPHPLGLNLINQLIIFLFFGHTATHGSSHDSDQIRARGVTYAIDAATLDSSPTVPGRDRTAEPLQIQCQIRKLMSPEGTCRLQFKHFLSKKTSLLIPLP